jgi:hypothetical protein
VHVIAILLRIAKNAQVVFMMLVIMYQTKSVFIFRPHQQLLTLLSSRGSKRSMLLSAQAPNRICVTGLK